MRQTERDQPAVSDLLRENEELKRQIQQLKNSADSNQHAGGPRHVWHPSSLTIWAIFLVAIAVIIVAFISGYLPLLKRQNLITGEAKEQALSLQRVEVVQVRRSSDKTAIELPGNIQAITEAPILARADGYLKRRMADIGDRVKAGQPLAEIEAPEVDDQIRQARAALQQARAGIDQAVANYERG